MVKDEIVKKLNSFSGKYSPSIVFSDWVHIMQIAIQNSCVFRHDQIWQRREKAYINIWNKYDQEEQEKFAEMFAMLVDSFDERIEDVLGYIYMNSNCYNKGLGQFFTPYHLSYLTAKLNIDINNLPRDEDGKISIHEPSCGGGGMVIGAIEYLAENNINFQKEVKVVAQDLDLLAVGMTYVQLSLLGVDAIIAQGDTLCEPYSPGRPFDKSRVWRSPKNTGALI